MGLPPTIPEQMKIDAEASAATVASVADIGRVLATPPDPPDRPAKAFEHPGEATRQTFQGTYWALRDLGVPSALAYLGAFLAATVVLVGGALGVVLFWLLKNVGATFTEDVLELVDAARKDIDSPVAKIGVVILNELLGTEFDNVQLATGDNVQAHIERAGQVGALFHNQLIGEFSPTSGNDAVPSSEPAHRFSGFLINFGVATAMVSVLGDVLSFGKFEQFRELGVEVARNLGLGRLNRQAMKPLMDTMIVQPYKWWLNTRFHPTQFKIGEVINPFAQTLMPVEDIFTAADLDGYSHDKVQKLIELHQKRLTVPEVELLARWKYWDPAFARDYIVKLGYPPELADTLTLIEGFKRVDARLGKLIDALEVNVVDGHITIEEFAAVLDTMPLTPNEVGTILSTVKFKAKSPHKQLTFLQLQHAFEQGLIDDTELRDRLAREGYAPEDVDILEILTLLAQAKLVEAAKKKTTAAQKKTAKKSGVPPPPPAP